MNLFIATLLFIIFLFLSCLHTYWAAGGGWGSDAVFPTKENGLPLKMPGKIPTLIVAFGLLCIGSFYLIKGGILHISLPIWVNNYGLWIISGTFILRAIGDFNFVGFFKKYKQTKFGKNDTKYYSPLCLIIGILTIILSLNN